MKKWPLLGLLFLMILAPKGFHNILQGAQAFIPRMGELAPDYTACLLAAGFGSLQWPSHIGLNGQLMKRLWGSMSSYSLTSVCTSIYSTHCVPPVWNLWAFWRGVSPEQLLSRNIRNHLRCTVDNDLLVSWWDGVCLFFSSTIECNHPSSSLLVG